jgi:hypothetical protein
MYRLAICDIQMTTLDNKEPETGFFCVRIMAERIVDTTKTSSCGVWHTQWVATMTIQYQMTIRQTLWVEQSRINTDY